MNERIEKEIKNEGTKTVVSIPFGGFPMKIWKEWEDDCNKNFGGCRWVKAYTDHLASRNSEENSALWKKIAELETEINSMKETPKVEEKEVIKTLGGGKIEVEQDE